MSGQSVLQIQDSPEFAAFLQGLALDPEDLAMIRSLLANPHPFDPAEFGFQPDGDQPAEIRDWIKRHPQTQRVILRLRRVQLIPSDPVSWLLWDDRCPDGDYFYQGSISSAAFAALMFAGIAAALDPAGETDLKACFLGSRSN